MCGISGFFSLKDKIDLFEYYHAHNLLKHRGPDDEGFIASCDNDLKNYRGMDTIPYYNNFDLLTELNETNLVLGHRRLSIIDLSEKGHQPFKYEHLTIVFNGEIFNYVEIKKDLIKLGYKFYTDSDTEVLIFAYHAYGDKCFSMLNGMWSVAIYDDEKKSIKLVRDRYGIKPLYYYYNNNSLYFSSEVKFLLKFIPNVKSNIDMVYDYVEHSKIWHTSETMFSQIYQIEPGELMIYDGISIDRKHYYELYNNDSVYQESIYNLVHNSVELRMRSDVQVGTMLSGGIDSTIISCIANKLTPHLKTFTITNNENDPEKDYIDRTLNTNDFEHHKININFDSFPVEDLIQTIEFPFKSFTVPSQKKLFQYVKNKTDVKVILSGEGADEIYSGYNIHPYIFILLLISKFKFIYAFREFYHLKNRINKNIFNTSISLLKTYLSTSKNLYIQRIKAYYNHNRSHFNKKRSLNICTRVHNDTLVEYLYDSITKNSLREYLMYSDLNSMSQSIEVRVPFMDYRLIESGLNIPSTEKVKKGIPKQPLRTSFKGLVPESILKRKDKKGFYTPYENWVKDNLISDMDEFFYNLKDENKFSYFNYKKFIKNYELFKLNKGKNDYTYFWRVYLLHKWKIVWKVID